MLRSQAIRLTKPALTKVSAPLSSRYLATAPGGTGPQPANPAQKDGVRPSTFYILAGSAAIAGSVWYYLQEPKDLNAKAKKDEEAIKRNAQELRDSTKKRGEDALKQSEAKYDAIKATAEDKLAAARSRAEGAKDNVESRYDSVKSTSQQSLTNARDVASRKVDEAKGKVEDGWMAVEKKGDEAKQSWSNWLGWGKAKAEEGKSDAAKKTAEAAGDVKKSAERRV